MPTALKPCPSSRALDELLDTDGPESEAIRARFHRTMLWRYRTGRRKPDIETAKTLAELSGGRVPMNGWVSADADATELLPSGDDDSEPTNPEVPVAKRQSSAPPPADVSDDEPTAVDYTPLSEVSTPRPLPVIRPAPLPTVTRPSLRERTDTDPDPNAGDRLPTPIPDGEL
jgi:hypothetical protein